MAACYQLAQSFVKMGSALTERVDRRLKTRERLDLNKFRVPTKVANDPNLMVNGSF